MKQRILMALVCLLLPAAAFAQVNAVVSGTVSDATGALIPGVEVTATNVNTGIETLQITNETGSYNFASLQPGTYRVSAALTSFQTQTFQNVLLSQGQQVRLNFALEVAAAVGQTVEVTIDADATLATTSASVGDVLPVQEVASLPLPVRDVLALIESTAGASGRNFGGQGQRALNMTRDGLIVNDTRYGTGAQVGTFVSSDLVEEVQVVVGNVDAEAGRGSGQVSLQTRSGTNEFHGALFYFNNNSAMNANTFFQNLQGAAKNYENRNQFGGRIGGPIIRNKAFFFVLIDEQRFLRKENYVATVLTQQARNGIFRYISGSQNGNALQANRSVDLQGNILNPGALRSFNLFSDVQDPLRTGISNNAYWRYVLNNMPLPNDYTVGDGLNTAGHRWIRSLDGLGGGNTVGNENNRDQLNIRFDYQINQANKVTFTTSREEDWGVTTNLLSDWPGVGFNGTNQYFPHLYTTQWTSTISNKILNEFRFGFKETSYHRRAPFQTGCCFGNEKESWDERDENAQEAYELLHKSNGYPVYPIPNIAAGNLMKHGFDTTRGQKSPTRQFSDTVSWTTGGHSFKGGWETVRVWSNGWNTTSEQIPTALFGDGNFAVSGITNIRFPGLNTTDAARAVDILNDLSASVRGLTFGRVINDATQTTWQDLLSDPRRFRHLTQSDWAFFFKDSWNVSQNLTLNIGVRYDKYGVMYDQKGMLARAKGGEKALYNYATNGTLTESQLVGKGSTAPDELFWPNDWNNIGPTFGFSYRIPWLDRTTVLRGGYGVNYAGNPVILDYENDFGNSPGSVDVYGNSATSGVPFTPTTYTTLSTVVMPLPAKTQPGLIQIPLNDKTQAMNTPTDVRATPYIQSFNLSLQHELGNNLTFEVSYIGNKGTKGFDKYNINEPELDSNGLLAAFNTTRAGGESPLFNQILMGLPVPQVGTVNGTTLTGSQAFRRWASTRVFMANGSVAQFADFLSTSSAITGRAGGLLENGRLSQAFITASPQFITAQIWGTSRNSTYHSMQTQLRKQFSNGMSGQFTYTWSKALGDTVAGETGATTLDPKNRKLNKGRLAFDRTHVITGHNTWELPFGTGKALLGGAGSWLNRVVGGWQLSTIASWNSGSPLTITSPIRTLGNMTNQSVPDIVGEFPKSTGEATVRNGYVEYFPGLSTVLAPATSAFGPNPDNLGSFSTLRNVVDASGNVLLTNPKPGTVGTLGTRWIEGPGSIGLDFSLAKKIQLRETVSMTLRADAIDALNTPQWENPAVDMNNANTFGRITDATGARKFTVSARVDF